MNFMREGVILAILKLSFFERNKMFTPAISKKAILKAILFIFIGSISNVFAQSSVEEYCATSILLNYSVEINQKVTAPDSKSRITPPALGETRSFWSNGPRDQRQVLATCRAIGKNCYVFVEDSLWGKPGMITQTEIEDLIAAFDSTTTSESIDSTKGIFDIESIHLGPVPDEIDHDPKIYILYLATTSNGYFSFINQTLSSTSNKVEMLYIAANINSRYLNQRPDYHKHIVSHELLHLIHWGQAGLNLPWMNEGCAEFASYICGYYEPGLMNTVNYHYLAGYSNLSLTVFQDVMSYPLTFTFMLYLAEKFGGVPVISQLVATRAIGIDAINAVLSFHGYSERFEEVFAFWQLAIYLDHISPVDSMYKFASIDIPPFDHTNNHGSYPIPAVIDTVQSWAGQFIGFVGAPDIRVIVEGSPGLSFSLVSASSPESIYIRPVKLDNAFKGEFRFSRKDTLTLVISNKSSAEKLYTYNADDITSVALNSEKQVPNIYQLFQNTPNPFRYSTTINFTVPQPSRVRLTIYNLAGQKIRSLLDDDKSVGLHTVRWEGQNDQGSSVASGVYFYVLEAGGVTYAKKMILVFR